MADKKLTISIATVANTDAVEKTVASLKKVSAETVTITQNQAAMAKTAADSEAANKALFDRLDKLKDGAKKLADESQSVSKSSATAAASARISAGAMTAVGLSTKIVSDYFREFSENIKTIDTAELERLDPLMAGMVETSKELFSFWEHPMEDITGITGIKESTLALNKAIQDSIRINNMTLEGVFAKAREDAKELKKIIASMDYTDKNIGAGQVKNNLLQSRADQRTLAVDPSKADAISGRNIANDANEKTAGIDRGLMAVEEKFNSASEAAINLRKAFDELQKTEAFRFADKKTRDEKTAEVKAAEQKADELRLELNRARTKAMQETEIVVQEATKGIESLALKGGDSITAAAQKVIESINAQAAAKGRELYPQETRAINDATDLLNDKTPDAEQGKKLAGISEDLKAQLDGRDQELRDKLTGIQTEAEAQAKKHEEIIANLKRIQAANNESMEVTIGEVEKAKITQEQTQKVTKAVDDVGRSFDKFSLSSVTALAALAGKLTGVTQTMRAMQRQIDAINANSR